MRIPSPAWRYVLALCLVLMAASAYGAERFAEGVDAFKRGDYERALALFQAARESGRDSPALRYNLGAVYFRLGRFDQAAAVYRGMLADRPALAAYNLGLVARAQDDREAAVRWFDRSLRSAEPGGRLAELAERALDRMRAPRDDEDGAGAGGVQLALGYDDNVAFAPAGDRDERDDAFVEGYTWGRYDLPLSERDRLRLFAGLYALGFADYGRYDLLDLSGGAEWRREVGRRWGLTLGAEAGRLWQDGDTALDSAGGRISATRDIGDGWSLRGGYAGTRYTAPNAYRYLEGTRQELHAAVVRSAGAWWWRLRYARRWDDRRDFTGTGTFASYSPRSHRLGLTWQREIGQDWSLDGTADWFSLDYPDPDVFTVDGARVERTRADEYLGASLRLQRHFRASWRVFAEYRRGENASNIEAEEYSRNVVMLGIGWRAP
ncbi:tetratricopeptide repeat protein [Ectothiorhodospiraceae bacterium WFHF3C12]|nr:tetratricopeptide repeat protein [Ectothiorhodospiraceae bacterium WFHF3C12]